MVTFFHSSQIKLVRAPLILSGYKALQRTSSYLLYPVSSVKEHNRRGRKSKSLRFYSHLFSCTQASRRWNPVIDLSRLNTFLHVERFKIETPESIRASLILGEWVLSIDLSDAYLLISTLPNSKQYLRFCHRSQVFSPPPFPSGGPRPLRSLQ